MFKIIGLGELIVLSKLNLKTLLLSYFYNRSAVLDNEYNTKLQYFRYHNGDEVDCLEIIIAKARKDLINEILNDIINLMHINTLNDTK